ncbi:Uncharacterized small protein, DUF1192 family [Faunimonas pinastri]|uniref:Uncharacterized small protein, DUF1192 family n=1 Tax=Faunimonas pinastri TaxID=1855383 RepID=A0A1H8Z828_9HYPH|nr:DUF1192 domain-containing protein [Faunimonas pinastri]SEP59758.1 Uncharacterized small protein, DUF1192 family [Faunimonas pinastri]
MAAFDDEPPKPQSQASGPGASLSTLSVFELEDRIRLYRAEIERMEREIQAKKQSRDAAESVFRIDS